LPCALSKVFRSGPINTCQYLGQDENVVVVQFVEEQNIRVAREHDYHGILSTNVSFLTQQITRDLLGYDVLLDYQVNQFESEDGTKPFAAAADDQRAICCFKPL